MIIKCPECGHQVSDKAPVCPSCGVEIAGKIIRCPHCGEIHFISDGICPNCHHSLRPSASSNQSNNVTPDGTEDTLSEEESIAQEERRFGKADDSDVVSDSPVSTPFDDSPSPASSPIASPSVDDDEPVQAIPLTSPSSKPAATPLRKPSHGDGTSATPPKKKSRMPLIISFIIAFGICLALLFAYNHANQNNEMREYQLAIDSRNPATLQSYLDTYKDAPQAHRDSVMALLNAIRASDPQWEQVKNSNDVNALKDYLAKNPNSPHKQDVLNRIDELDWQTALKTHDFANYLSLHQNGHHAAAAVDSVKLTMDMPASGADRQKAVSAVRSFLVAINSHNADRVKNCFETHLDYFNEKSSVSNDEALNYMAIVYRDAERLNWHVDNADAAKVSRVGEGASAQYSITMPARLSVNYTSGNNVQSNYNIQAKVNGAGRITAIKLIRLAEPTTSSKSESSGKSESSSKPESSSKSESSSSKSGSSSKSKSNSSSKSGSSSSKPKASSKKK